MIHRTVLLISMLFGLMFVACNSEESKLEAEIINEDTLVSVKSSCEVSGKAMAQYLGLSGGSLEKCIGTLFDTRIKENCEKGGFDLGGTTCNNVRKRVKARVANYVAELPKTSEK